MTGIPGPFQREYAFDALLSGNPSPLFKMQGVPVNSTPGTTNIPLMPPAAPASPYAALPAVPAPPAFSPPSGPAPMAGAQIGAPNFPPGMSPTPPANTLQSTLDLPPSQTPSSGLSPQAMQNIGMHAAGASAFVAVVGAVAGAIANRESLKAQARTLEHEAFISNVNARIAERQASEIMRQGRRQIAQVTAEAGQVKAQQQTRAAARGVVIGEGSAGDVTATTDIAKEVEMLAINQASVARASAARRQAVSLQGQSLMSRVSAGNLRRSARAIQPAAAGGAQFISSVGDFAYRYEQRRR